MGLADVAEGPLPVARRYASWQVIAKVSVKSVVASEPMSNPSKSGEACAARIALDGKHEAVKRPCIPRRLVDMMALMDLAPCSKALTLRKASTTSMATFM